MKRVYACANPGCEFNGVQRVVELPEIQRGVIAVPILLCSICERDLLRMDVAGVAR